MYACTLQTLTFVCWLRRFPRHLNACYQFGFQIMNGTTSDDECGCFTYVSPAGCSVIDYFIVSRSLLVSLSMSLVAQKIESKHMPVELGSLTEGVVFAGNHTKTLMSPWWRLCTLYSSHARWSYRWRLGSLLLWACVQCHV